MQELRELAAHLATISDHFAALIGPSDSSNTLAHASLAWVAAPPFSASSKQTATEKTADTSKSSKQTATEETADTSKRQKIKMSTEEVHTVLVARGLVSAEMVTDVNACFKKGVHLGYINLCPDVLQESVIYEGKCFNCAAGLVCTVGQVVPPSMKDLSLCFYGSTN